MSEQNVENLSQELVEHNPTQELTDQYADKALNELAENNSELDELDEIAKKYGQDEVEELTEETKEEDEVEKTKEEPKGKLQDRILKLDNALYKVKKELSTYKTKAEEYESLLTKIKENPIDILNEVTGKNFDELLNEHLYGKKPVQKTEEQLREERLQKLEEKLKLEEEQRSKILEQQEQLEFHKQFNKHIEYINENFILNNEKEYPFIINDGQNAAKIYKDLFMQVLEIDPNYKINENDVKDLLKNTNQILNNRYNKQYKKVSKFKHLLEPEKNPENNPKQPEPVKQNVTGNKQIKTLTNNISQGVVNSDKAKEDMTDEEMLDYIAKKYGG